MVGYATPHVLLVDDAYAMQEKQSPPLPYQHPHTAPLSSSVTDSEIRNNHSNRRHQAKSSLITLSPLRQFSTASIPMHAWRGLA